MDVNSSPEYTILYNLSGWHTSPVSYGVILHAICIKAYGGYV